MDFRVIRLFDELSGRSNRGSRSPGLRKDYTHLWPRHPSIWLLLRGVCHSPAANTRSPAGKRPPRDRPLVAPPDAARGVGVCTAVVAGGYSWT
jgi:hypothetical protein